MGKQNTLSSGLNDSMAAMMVMTAMMAMLEIADMSEDGDGNCPDYH